MSTVAHSSTLRASGGGRIKLPDSHITALPTVSIAIRRVTLMRQILSLLEEVPEIVPARMRVSQAVSKFERR